MTDFPTMAPDFRRELFDFLTSDSGCTTFDFEKIFSPGGRPTMKVTQRHTDLRPGAAPKSYQISRIYLQLIG